MNKKQKSLLIRIIIAAVFFVPLYLISEEYVRVDIPKWVIIVLFLIPYLTVGYDILRKAALGIKNKFDNHARDSSRTAARRLVPNGPRTTLSCPSPLAGQLSRGASLPPYQEAGSPARRFPHRAFP